MNIQEIETNLLSRKVKEEHPNCTRIDGEEALYEDVHLADVTMRDEDEDGRQYITAVDTYTRKSAFFNPVSGVREHPLWMSTRPIKS